MPEQPQKPNSPATGSGPGSDYHNIMNMGQEMYRELRLIKRAGDPEDSVDRRYIAGMEGKFSATSTEGGTLVLSFADGSTLRCDPDLGYEAWQVVGGAPQHLVACSPGGELAVWDSSYAVTEDEGRETVERVDETSSPAERIDQVVHLCGVDLEPRDRYVGGSVHDRSVHRTPGSGRRNRKPDASSPCKGCS